MARQEIPTSGLWGTISSLINANFSELYGASYINFIAYSDEPISISTDKLNPTYFNGYVLVDNDNFTLADANTGGVRNVSGRAIRTPTGSISFNPDNTGGGTARIVTFSEVTDGLDPVPANWVWAKNDGSVRKVEVSSSGESFKTSVSFLPTWPNNTVVRFGAYLEAGAIDLIPTTADPEGEVITGHSVIWDIGGGAL